MNQRRNNMKQLVCLIVLLINFQISSGYPTFEEYISDFKKSYSSQQKIWRKEIYQERISNFTSITTFTPGVNNLTDWTHQQISRLKSSVPIPHENQGGQISVESTQSDSYLRVSAPQSLDWRAQKAVTSVKNQGQCGSCWAFAAAAYVQSKLIIQKQYSTSVDLSQQYLVSCTPGSNCKGGIVEDALKVVAYGGIPYQSSFAYNPYGAVSSQICSTKNKIKDGGSNSRTLSSASDSKIIILLQKGPVAVSLSANQWQNYGSGVFECAQNSKIDHAALLVGYTKDYWIVKNQWNRQWGQSGYIRITRKRTTPYQNCYIGSYIDFMDSDASTNFSQKLLSPWVILCALLTFVFM